MSLERKPGLPPWARRERLGDLAWIAENLPVFWPAATAAFEAYGRGALVVDTTAQPVEGQGNPFAYFPRRELEHRDDEDVKRMVREYDPAKEFVVMLLKSDHRASTYRVQLRGGEARPKPRSGTEWSAGSGDP